MSSLLNRIAAASLALIPMVASAQPVATIVITAARTEQPLESVLADVTVIGRDAIERSGAASLAELLRTSAGVETSQNGGVAGLTGVFLRGSRTAQTLVLVDGVRLENPTSGGANLEFIPVASIERIEIVKGPLSSLYGSGAIGGVIQIFTRGASDGSGTGLRQEASVSAGSLGTSAVSAALAARSATTRWNLSASHDQTDGFDATLPGSVSYQLDRDPSRRDSFAAGFAHRFSEQVEIGFDARVNRGHTAYDDAWSTPASAVLTFRSDAVSAFARLHPIAAWDTTLRAGSTTIDYDYAAFSFAPRTRSQTITWQNSYALESGSLLFGLEHLRQQIAGEGVSTGDYAYVRDDRATRSAYLGYELERAANTLRINLRRDDVDSVGAQTSGTLAYGWRASEQWRLRASVGSAFRAPTFDDLYSPFGANPALRPERSLGWEFGADYSHQETTVRSSLFVSRISDAIELDGDFVPQNLASTRVRGLSVDARHAIGALVLRAAVTVQDPEGRWVDPITGEQSSGELARRARRYGTLGANWHGHGWRLDGELVTQGRRVDSDGAELGGYAVVNLDAAWSVARDWEIFVRATNLGDRAYQTASGYASAPRQLLLGVRFARTR